MSYQDQMMENYNYWHDGRVQDGMFNSIWQIVEQGAREAVVQFEEDWLTELLHEEAAQELFDKWVDGKEEFTLEYLAAAAETVRRREICDQSQKNAMKSSGEDVTWLWQLPQEILDGLAVLNEDCKKASKVSGKLSGEIYEAAWEKVDLDQVLESKGFRTIKVRGDDRPFCMTLPIKNEVCSLCSGTGKTTDPNIDCGGISREDFAEDPDFEHDYFSGRYDQTCARCKGINVEAHPKFPKWLADAIESHDQSEWEGIRESCAERAMGA